VGPGAGGTYRGGGGGGGREQRWGECARAERELEAALAEMVLRGLREPNSDAGSAAETSGGDNIIAFMRAQQQREPIAEPATLSDDTVPVVDGYVGSLVSKESEIRMQTSTRTASPHVEQARTAAEVAATTADTSSDEASAGANTELQSATFARGAAAVDEEMVMRALATLQDTDTGLLISLLDFGGQSVFEVIHHLFLTRNGVYALVFNMEWLAHDGPEKDKALRFMRNWLSSIAVHTLDRSTGMSAPVVFVGTRLDHVSTGAQHEQISTVLYENFSDNLAWRSVIENEDGRDSNGKAVQWFFAVDNKQGKDGPTLRHLMSVVHAAMDAAAYTHKEVPLSWLKVMDTMAAAGKDCLPLHEVVSIGAGCGVAEEEVALLLTFLHDMGHLLWIDEPGLRDVVVLDPVSYLVTPATVIICKLTPDHEDSTHHFMAVHRECDKQHKREWSMLKQSGVLHTKLLPILWHQYEAHTASLLLLMVKFGLLVPLRGPGRKQQDPVAEATGADSVTQYLVPTLLSPASPEDPAVVEWTDRPFMSCYFVFTLHDDLQCSNTLTSAELRTSGFLPTGMFERLLGKALSWSQETTRSGSINVQSVLLHKDLAVLSFGGQRFRFVNCADIHCIRVDVEGCNPLGVVQRLLEFVGKIKDECLKHLCCFPAVRYTSNSTVPVTEHTTDPLGKVLPASDMLIPLQQLRLAAKGESMLAWRGGRALMSVTDIKAQYGPWLQVYDLRDCYDVFISYRWGPHDSQFTEQLFDMFTNFSVGASSRAAEVFLDTKRLQKGRRFKSDFAAALTHSSVALPVISCSALDRIYDHAADVVDNVLLEWIIILQCAASKRIHKVYPIVFGRKILEVGSGGQAALSTGAAPAFTDFFAEYGRYPLPEIAPTATLAQAAELLEENRVPLSKQFHTLTVASIVREMLQFMLCKASDIPLCEVVEVFAEGVVSLLNEVDATAVPAPATSIPVISAVVPVHGAKQGVEAVATHDSATTTPHTVSSVPSEPVLRRLVDLTPSEVGQLMAQCNLEAVRKLFVAREVSGVMLSFVEEATDLLSEEYGLTSAGLAKGLLAKIKGWKDSGVLL
jgi:hypothetical protein